MPVVDVDFDILPFEAGVIGIMQHLIAQGEMLDAPNRGPPLAAARQKDNYYGTNKKPDGFFRHGIRILLLGSALYESRNFFNLL
jgi:hypothetical protein